MALRWQRVCTRRKAQRAILLWASIGAAGIIATLAVNKAENGVTAL